MGPNESQRLALMNSLNSVLGEQEAATLMDSLPPYEWPEVATKADLGQLEASLRAEMALLFAKQTRTLMLAMTGFAMSTWLALLVPVLVA
ncbi:hypothetical protein [Candidatus Poriferisodalis sp.]|uniref:hypothetical protein n=1 Tax=Candidatus Poriferisodalis sp. TaxID=3101277 RepID=UPI003B01891A